MVPDRLNKLFASVRGDKQAQQLRTLYCFNWPCSAMAPVTDMFSATAHEPMGLLLLKPISAGLIRNSAAKKYLKSRV